MPYKTDFQLGLETMLNNPKTSFMQNPKTFNEIYKQSGMSMSAMLKHVGGKARTQKKQEPTDAEKSEKRLDELAAKNQSK